MEECKPTKQASGHLEYVCPACETATTKDLFVNQLVDIVCFRSGGALLAAHQATDYNGVGGVLVKQHSEGYVFEPIKTALNYLYPQCLEEML